MLTCINHKMQSRKQDAEWRRCSEYFLNSYCEIERYPCLNKYCGLAIFEYIHGQFRLKIFLVKQPGITRGFMRFGQEQLAAMSAAFCVTNGFLKVFETQPF